ncbi:MAG: hypothetical protein SCM11_04845 [Bacillota bacterium]|nr:hypothetical protein [Bacillota bacterium]
MVKTLEAGVARTDITPPTGTVLMGYAPRQSTAVHDALTATALVLKFGDEKTTIISITTTIIDDEEVERIREGVNLATGIDSAKITVCSCQIHSGPATQTCYGWDDRNDAYCQGILEPAIIQAVQKADQTLRPVKVGVGSGSSLTGINRRQVTEQGSIVLGQNPWGPYDPEMTVVRLVTEDLNPLANLVHFGAHPTSIGATGDITRDWPGIMIDRLEQVTGGITLFLNGAVGDIGPRLSNGKTTGDLQQMIEVGNRAAFDAVTICRRISEFRSMDLETQIGVIRLPYRPLPSFDMAKEKLVQSEARKDQPGLGKAEYSYWQRVIQEYTSGNIKSEKVRIQTITRLGPIVFVPFSGEPFAEIVLRMRQYSPYAHTLCLSTTNGSDGYLPTRDSLHRGGYEVDVAKAFSAYILAENIDDILISENLQLIRAL